MYTVNNKWWKIDFSQEFARKCQHTDRFVMMTHTHTKMKEKIYFLTKFHRAPVAVIVIAEKIPVPVRPLPFHFVDEAPEIVPDI